MNSKKAQVWVETVVYTLIVFAVIGLVLSFVKPKIDESKDRAVIEQSIGIIEEIDHLINNVRTASGNKRVLDLSIKKGSLNIDGKNNRVFFEMDSNYKYSDEGKCVEKDLVYCTLEKGDLYLVNITKEYNDYNITFGGENSPKKIHPAPQKYKLLLSNQGEDSSGNTIINFELK